MRRRIGTPPAQRLTALCTVAFVSLLTWPDFAAAEPYFAVDRGLQCSACHTHAAGGGKRTAYGNVFAQTVLPATTAGDGTLWTGNVNPWLSIGGDLRGRFEATDDDIQGDQTSFDVTRATVYVQASMFDDKVSLYIDQQVAPTSSINREAYVLLKANKLQLTAGQFYLPYGLRLQDDTAFVRRATGINFTNPDRGVQIGYESGPWSSALSLTNGSGGGAETDDGKQISAMTSYAAARWRLGASVNHNDSDGGDRSMANLFGGFKTGPIAWLLEIDAIQDEVPGAADLDSLAGIAEANWGLRRGHNLKISYEYLDPNTDVSENHDVRWSALYEYTPYPYLQARFGLRSTDGPPASASSNRDVAFVELHGLF